MALHAKVDLDPFCSGRDPAPSEFGKKGRHCDQTRMYAIVLKVVTYNRFCILQHIFLFPSTRNQVRTKIHYIEEIAKLLSFTISRLQSFFKYD
jgi:hypothetical protein